jgi:hypothetical protein
MAKAETKLDTYVANARRQLDGPTRARFEVGQVGVFGDHVVTEAIPKPLS